MKISKYAPSRTKPKWHEVNFLEISEVCQVESSRHVWKLPVYITTAWNAFTTSVVIVNLSGVDSGDCFCDLGAGAIFNTIIFMEIYQLQLKVFKDKIGAKFMESLFFLQ